MARGKGNSQQGHDHDHDHDHQGDGDHHRHHHGDGNGHEDGPDTERVLLDDEELAAKFDALVTAAQEKGFSHSCQV